MIQTPPSTSGIKFDELYSQAVITMCWRVTPLLSDEGSLGQDRSYRQLVVASIELIPQYWHLPANLSVSEQGVKIGKHRLFFIRLIVSANDGVAWYNQILRDKRVTMFWDKNKLVRFGPTLSADDQVFSFPRFPETAFLADSPIIPKCWAHAQVNHLVSNSPLDELVGYIANETVADWIGDRLCWRLNENLEYLGTVTLIAPNPYYCHSQSHLCPSQAEGDADQLELHFDRDVSSEKLQLLFAERYSGDEIGGVQRIAAVRDGMSLMLRGLACETGYAVMDANNVIWDIQPFAPYIHRISINMEVGEKELVCTCKDGQIQKLPKYSSVKNISIVGEDEKIPELTLSHKTVTLRRRSQIGKHASNQFINYKQSGEAERKIRELIHSASKSLLIVDPYYSPDTATLFLWATRSSEIKTTILCSVGGLKLREDGSDPAKELSEIVNAQNKARPDSVAVLVSPQDNLHDRFIVVDETEVWLLGSSLNTLGDSLSVIVKLPNSLEAMSKIEFVKNDKLVKSLTEWMNLREKSCNDRNLSDACTMSIEASPQK